MNIAAYVLQEIAGQEETGGASLVTIRTMVDGRQRVMLTDDELSAAVDELERRGLVTRAAAGFRLSDTALSKVPRGPSGSIVMSQASWDQATRALGLDEAAA